MPAWLRQLSCTTFAAVQPATVVEKIFCCQSCSSTRIIHKIRSAEISQVLHSGCLDGPLHDAYLDAISITLETSLGIPALA
ncbi:hypothetical protein O988_07565 [Pseudogymnoascus sp. VKM F-3808]|nr:hypothetical protein O988_07565 [Pseudogymnoascus sp. VKM F-3808]